MEDVMATLGQIFKSETEDAAKKLAKEPEITSRVISRVEAWANKGPGLIDSNEPDRALLYLLATNGNLTDQCLHILGDMMRRFHRRTVLPLWIIAALLLAILWRVW